MRTYSDIISLNKNERGIWHLDTSKGCSSGCQEDTKGCYNDCYAAKSAKIYGYDFSKTILRDFKDIDHQRQIVRQINKIDMPFIRIGCTSDPSENWDHTFSILKKIRFCTKEIVLITKHWTSIPDNLLSELLEYNVCINTSISAMDNPERLERCLSEYHRLKPFCKSFLRIVSCDFNTDNTEGKRLSDIQYGLFKNENTIDTVFRPSKDNPLISSGVINVRKGRFMKGMQLMSKFNRKTYIGNCANCTEKCGIFNNLFRREKLPKQLNLFD